MRGDSLYCRFADVGHPAQRSDGALADVPLMDPAIFLITAGTLGWDFAIAKPLPPLLLAYLAAR